MCVAPGCLLRGVVHICWVKWKSTRAFVSWGSTHPLCPPPIPPSPTPASAQVFHQMQAAGVVPDLVSHNTLINGYAKQNNIKKVMQVCLRGAAHGPRYAPHAPLGAEAATPAARPSPPKSGPESRNAPQSLSLFLGLG